MSNLTTRNQLRGKVTGVTLGSVMAEVKVDVHGDEFVAVITKHSAERLGLQDGDEVTVLIKATEVMLAKGSMDSVQLTTRNQIPGKVDRIEMGTGDGRGPGSRPASGEIRRRRYAPQHGAAWARRGRRRRRARQVD